MIEISIPLRIVSESNMREHWAKKNTRRRLQHNAISLCVKPKLAFVKLPCQITLIRIAPRMLDKEDNLPISFKAVKDKLAALLTGDDRPGRADSDPRLQWKYEQKKGLPKSYSILIRIESL